MPWSEFLYWWLVYSALVSLAVLAVGTGAVLLCRQPTRRLRIIELSLAGCLIAPWLSMIPGYPQLAIGWRQAAPPERHEVFTPPSAEQTVVPMVSQGEAMPLPVSDVPSWPISETVETPTQAWDVSSWLVALYLFGVAIGIAWWLVGVAALVRIIWTAHPAPPQCRRLLAEIAGRRSARVRLLASRRTKQPFVSASWPTTIVLPDNLCDDEQAVRWALAHEWTHIERRDFRAWFAAGLARVLFFYQPLVWWLRRQLRLCQDFVADAGASRQAPQPEDYAEFLTLRAAAGSLHPAMVGLGMGFRKSELYRRIVMLVQNPPLENRVPRLWTLSVTCAAVVLVAVVAALTVSPRAFAQGEPATQSEQFDPIAPSFEPVERTAPEKEKAPLKKSATAKKVAFVIGPNKFWGGDKVTIEEVWSELGTLSKEDTVTVKGTYTLASHPKANLCLFVTEDAAKAPSNYQPTTILPIEAGTSTFEFTRPVACDGHLHLSFYPEESGGWFGCVYFGTEAQMKEIAGWKEWVEKPAKPDSPSDAKPAAFFKAKFPNGVTVEFLGVAEHPSDDKPWWRPDGLPLAQRPYKALFNGSSFCGDTNLVIREFAIRVSPAPPKEAAWICQFDPDYSYSANFMKPIGSGKLDVKDIRGAAIGVPVDRKTMNFRFGIADGPWELSYESDGWHCESFHRADGSDIEFFAAYEKNGDVILPIAHTITGHELRVIAIGKTEPVYCSELTQACGGKIGKISAKFPKRSLEDIQAFRLQGRPYQWVEFRNISLQPRGKTNVQIRQPATPTGSGQSKAGPSQ